MMASTIQGTPAGSTVPAGGEDDMCPIRRRPGADRASSVSPKGRLFMQALAFALLTLPVAAQEDSVTKKASADSLAKKAGSTTSELVNIVVGNKKIRAYGWGEYRVGGRCLCCDNMNDGDCIVVHTIERTDKERISQIIDGKIEGDAGTTTTFFGDLRKRDRPEPVNLLMVDISLGKTYDIKKAVVFTMIDKEKHANFLSNCELGYYDQFGRLLWTGKVESKKYDEPITFELENPVSTKAIMLRVKGGKSRITEVAVFSEGKKE